MTDDALGIEEAPMALDAAELRVLPRLVEVLEEEVTSAVVVCLTERIGAFLTTSVHVSRSQDPNAEADARMSAATLRTLAQDMFSMVSYIDRSYIQASSPPRFQVIDNVREYRTSLEARNELAREVTKVCDRFSIMDSADQPVGLTSNL